MEKPSSVMLAWLEWHSLDTGSQIQLIFPELVWSVNTRDGGELLNVIANWNPRGRSSQHLMIIIGGKKWNQWVLNPCFHPSSSIPDATWAPWAKSFILITLFCRNAKVQARRCSRVLQQSLKLWPCSQRRFYVLQKHLSHRPVNPVCVQNDLAF